MDILIALELFATITGLCFIILMIYQNIWCWPIGILSSIASIFLFYSSKLYMESILYLFYVAIGIYGWWVWNHVAQKKAVSIATPRYHFSILLIGALLTAGIGWINDTYTDAARPVADAGSTIFSFIASYMEAHRILSSWVFWVIINLFSIWLYMDRGFKLYSGLMVLYFLLSVAGYLQWKKDYDQHVSTAV